MNENPELECPMSVPVYEWLCGGEEIGCGTRAEFDHWTAEGTMAEGTTLGRIIAHEPASEDARRARAWAA
jgi:hypothetical protein